MSHYSGPVRTMPGFVRLLAAKPEVFCDDHTDVVATHRVQGETDSFGAEYIDMCASCYSEFDAARKAREENPGARYCEMCKTAQTSTRARRDPDEGMAGPLYMWCGSCHNSVISDFIGDDED